MKLQELRKQVITRVILSAAVLAVIGGLAVASYFIRTGYEDDLSKVNNQARDTNSNIQMLEQLLEQAKKAIESYALLQGSKKPSPTGINQEYLTQVLENFKERYVLTDLSLKMAAPAPLKDKDLAKNNLDIEHVMVSLQFSGLSDELLFSFMDNLLRVLPGYTQVDSIQMERKGALDNKVLADIMQEKYSPLVQTGLTFHWIAIKPKPTLDKQSQTNPLGGAPNAAP